MKDKSPKEMTEDILSALRMKDAPEAILIEEYLRVQIERHIKENKNEKN